MYVQISKIAITTMDIRARRLHLEMLRKRSIQSTGTHSSLVEFLGWEPQLDNGSPGYRCNACRFCAQMSFRSLYKLTLSI